MECSVTRYILDPKNQRIFCVECDIEGIVEMLPEPNRYVVSCPNGHFLSMEEFYAGERAV